MQLFAGMVHIAVVMPSGAQHCTALRSHFLPQHPPPIITTDSVLRSLYLPPPQLAKTGPKVSLGARLPGFSHHTSHETGHRDGFFQIPAFRVPKEVNVKVTTAQLQCGVFLTRLRGCAWCAL